MKKIIFPFTSLLCSGLICVACAPKTEEVVIENQPTAVIEQSVTTTPAVDALTAATMTNKVSFNGTLVIPPQEMATITLSMGGIVKSTSLLPGASVAKGSILATLENPEFIILQQIFLDSHAQLEYLEAEYIRQQNLANAEVASKKKLQESKANYLSTKSQMQSAAAQLSLLGLNAESLLTQGVTPYIEVKAPFSGFVNNVQMNVGKHFAAGETLCEVINKQNMLIALTTYEKDLANISVGDTVDFKVNGMSDKIFKATLISIGQEVDEINRSLKIYAKVLNPEPLFRPGMYVTAQIEKQHE